MVRRQGDELSLAEKALVEMARQIDCEVECTKDGRVFDRDLDAYAAVVSYTCGRPARSDEAGSAHGPDGNPPLSESGWKNLDAAVRGGKPFVAIHPGIWLLPEAAGADCLGHGSQQVARIKVVSPRFPGAEKLGDSFSMLEEWFSLIRFAKDLHVVLVQDCAGMDKTAAADRRCYDRPPFPCHVGPDARQGARVLHLLGPSRRRVVEQDLRADPAGRAVVGLGPVGGRHHAEHRPGRSAGQRVPEARETPTLRRPAR